MPDESNLSTKHLDDLLVRATSLRDNAGAQLAGSRALIRALKHVRAQIEPVRVRGRHRTRLRSASLAVAALSQGLTAGDLADLLRIPIERVGKLLGGATPTPEETTMLADVVPTWAPPAVKQGGTDNQ